MYLHVGMLLPLLLLHLPNNFFRELVLREKRMVLWQRQYIILLHKFLLQSDNRSCQQWLNLNLLMKRCMIFFTFTACDQKCIYKSSILASSCAAVFGLLCSIVLSAVLAGMLLWSVRIILINITLVILELILAWLSFEKACFTHAAFLK